MRTWQIGESLAVESGGTSASCAQLANHLAVAGLDVTLITFGRANGAPEWSLDARVISRRAPAWPSRVGYSPSFSAAARSAARPDLVHLHGLWRLCYAQAARYAARAGAPLVVSTHGMLHRHALEQRAALKPIARRLFQDDLLRRARCLHTTAEAERDEIRRLGFAGPIAVVAWGVDLPDPGRSIDDSADGPRVALYLGRLHRGKGLETLLRAWALVRGRFPEWRLIIAGHDEGRHRAALVALASEVGAGESVRFAGPCGPAERERMFAAAGVVVLPSPSENFGLVVAEALVRGVPVIATRGAPWASLADERCGWWVPYGVDALAAALADALARPPGELRAMGERGRRFARARFAWETAARRMIELYAWAVGRGPQPSFVQS